MKKSQTEIEVKNEENYTLCFVITSYLVLYHIY
jgi:hypothetical protein